MTNKEKARLKAAVLDKVVDLIEFGVDDYYDLKHVDADEIKEQLRTWMLKLPGEKWNNMLD